VKAKDSTILAKRKREIAARLDRGNLPDDGGPVLSVSNVQYEMADRARAIDCGGIGAFHVMARNVGLIDAIDSRLRLLKLHLPYHESDHVMNLAYSALAGGVCLDDIERLRNDATYLDALGAARIPDPTTAGDFVRRFREEDVLTLMECVNAVRPKLWDRRLTRAERFEAVVDLDGTLAGTTGECKEGMDMSFKGVWGYHPLLISLANTSEPLYLVNRPGNRPSHDGASEWIARAIALARRSFVHVCLRGDTDFGLTREFDRWTDDGVLFALGMDATENRVEIAESLPPSAWKPLKRRSRRSGARRRPRNVKAAIVAARQYDNVELKGEEVAEFEYQPVACKRSYTMIVVRKDLSVFRRQQGLFREDRYFFYITNRDDMTAEELVFFCRGRCHQENLIEQLKNGLNAMRMPVGDLVSNWAYMVIVSLAWTLKAWFALLVRDGDKRETLLRMEFRRFLNGVIRVPCQIVRTGRRILYRLLNWTEWTRTFLQTFDRIRRLQLA
jgi:hypothetical protein